MRSPTELRDAELAALAADGQRAAAGELLSRHLHLLTVMARRLAVPPLDPDDLLSEAIANLLAKWAQGEGPRENVEAYIIRSMRNRVTDELRSPRSKVVALDLDLVPSRDDDFEHHRAELHHEFTLVREALARLPEDQQKVLVATVVDGRKPGDLVEELKRPAGAIYSLSRRAKGALRRALLQTMLVEDAPAVCKQSAAALPQTIAPDPTELADAPGTEHLHECKRCSAVWSRYLGLMSYAGVGSLLAVGCAAVPPVPVAAGVAAGIDGGLHQSGGGVPTPRGRKGRALYAGVGVAAAASVVVLVGGGATSDSALMAAGIVPKPVSTFAVEARSAGAERAIEVRFGVDRSWTVQRLAVTVPSGLELTRAPEGWTCDGSGVITCVTSRTSPSVGSFTFAGGSAPGDRAYSLVIEAAAGPARITGSAEGDFPP